MMGEQDFNVLLKGYLDESLSASDLEMFLTLAGKPENILLLQQSFEKDLQNDPAQLSSPGQAENAWRILYTKLDFDHHAVRPRRFSLFWVAASLCLLCVLGAVYFYNNQHQKNPEVARIEVSMPVWLKPEHIGATLYLTNGDSVQLNNEQKGVIASQGGMEIFQSPGSVQYSGSGGEGLFNEIKTGRGKLYHCILPDQTGVWLNAGSSIKYPLHFTAALRSVEITGEAYFEITHHAEQPFQVRAGGQVLEDIGTSFNIDAFGGSIRTTLIEGSVNVAFNNQKKILKPGEQTVASFQNNELTVNKKANLDQALAWKNGLFYFQNSGLREVMKQIADWYQTDVIYQGPDSKELFSGQIDKSLPLARVLEGLRHPGVAFSLRKDHEILVVQK